MNKQALQWLYEELPSLVNKDILSQTTADKLHEYYGELKNTDKKSFAVILCSILGALLIASGIILLFAHNWEQLSRPIRAGVALLPLIIGQILAFWVLLKHATSHALKESIATFISLMVGAAIALISQTYNISGDMADFILVWMLLILPLAYLMETTIPALIYTVGISIWLSYYLDAPKQAIIFWPLLAMVIPHFIWSLHQDKYNFRAGILVIAIATGFYLGMAQTIANLDKLWPGSWFIICSSIATVFYLLGILQFKNLTTNWQKPLYYFGGLGIFVIMFLLSFRSPWELIKEHKFVILQWNLLWPALVDYFLTLAIAGTAIAMFVYYAKRKDLVASLLGALPIVAIIGYGIATISVVIPMLLFNAFMFIVSITQITVGIKTNNLSTVNIGMFVLAALILARFFDNDANFIAKGLVFIIIGIGFLIRVEADSRADTR